jgi:soluble lytic murein transglycosylase
MGTREFFDRLRAKDTAFLFDYLDGELEAFGRLGPNAYYYAARAFEKAGAIDGAATLSGFARAGAKGLARRESLRAYARLQAASERWEATLAGVSEYRASFGEDLEISFYEAEALYALERWKDLAAASAAIRENWPTDASKRISRLLRFEAVAQFRLSDPAWSKSLRLSVRDYAYTDDTKRAWDAIGIEAISAAFKGRDLEHLEFRMLLGPREYGQAWAYAEKRLSSWLVSGCLPQLAGDVGRCALAAKKGPECDVAFAALEKKIPKDTSGLLYTVRYWRARFALGAGDQEGAVKLFKSALAATAEASQIKLLTWYIADTLHTLDPKRAAEYLASIAPEWTDKYYFTDVIDRTIAGLVAAGAWDALRAFYDKVGPYTYASYRTRMEYLLGRARELGYVKKGPSAREWYNASIATGGSTYFYMLSSYRLGVEPEVLPSFESNAGPVATESESESLRFFRDYVAWGLQDEAYLEIVAMLDRLSDAEIRGLARIFEREGFYAEAMRLTGKLRDRAGYVERRQDYQVIYPQYYLHLIRPICDRFGVDVIMWYGLMRTESYFDHDIVSWAGAVGLTQLMPSTAAAEAEKLKLSAYELTDPRDNLLIGISHFSGLLAATDNSVVRSLAAYNAGLSRVRRWEKASGTLPEDLFAESFSIAETRNYNRFNLVATVNFGVLYGSGVPSDYVKLVLKE